jgi:hypothetical protein
MNGRHINLDPSETGLARFVVTAPLLFDSCDTEFRDYTFHCLFSDGKGLQVVIINIIGFGQYVRAQEAGSVDCPALNEN